MRNRPPIAIDVRHNTIRIVPTRRRVERAHVRRADQRHERPEPDRHRDQHDRGHSAERRQRVHLAGVALPFSNGLRQRVEEARERAAGLGLDVDGRRHVLEVGRADSLAHGIDRLVERSSELLLSEHACELLRGRRRAVVDDCLERRAKAVPGPQRRGDRREHVGQLSVERLRAPVRGDPQGRDAVERKPSSISRRTSAGGAPTIVPRIPKTSDDESCDVGQIAHAQLQSGILERPRQPLRAGKVVHRALRPFEHSVEASTLARRPRRDPAPFTYASSKRLSSDLPTPSQHDSARQSEQKCRQADDHSRSDRAARDGRGKQAAVVAVRRNPLRAAWRSLPPIGP